MQRHIQNPDFNSVNKYPFTHIRLNGLLYTQGVEISPWVGSDEERVGFHSFGFTINSREETLVREEFDDCICLAGLPAFSVNTRSLFHTRIDTGEQWASIMANVMEFAIAESLSLEITLQEGDSVIFIASIGSKDHMHRVPLDTLRNIFVAG